MKYGYVYRFLASLIAGLLLLTLGCAPGVTPAPAAPTPAARPAKPAWEVEWGRLIDAAKKEKRLALRGDAPPLVRDAIVEAVKGKFGIEVEVVSGRGGEVVAKLLQERKAGIFDGDVYIGGATTPTLLLKPNGLLQPLDEVLSLPEVVDEKMWRGGIYLDKAHMIAAGFGAVQPPIFVNSEQVKKGEIKSLDDLLDPRWKGKVAINDPTVTGVGKFTTQFITMLKGEAFVRQLVEQKPTVIRDQRQLTEWVARGKFPLAIGGEPTIIKEFVKAGAPLAYVVPSDGSFITTGTGCVGLIDRAPHPNAARLFVNWILTREGQTIWAKAADFASRRLDVSTEHLASELIPQPGVKYGLSDEEFQLESDRYLKLFKEIFKPVM